MHIIEIINIIRKLRKHNGKLFCVRHRNRWKQPTFRITMIQTKFTLSHIKLNICMSENKFTPHKQNFSSTEMQRTPMQTKVYYKLFLLCPGWNNSQSVKSSSGEKYFYSLCIDTPCFDACFLFHVITRGHYLSWKFLVTLTFSQPAYCCFHWNKHFWKKSVFYVNSTITVRCYRFMIKFIKLFYFVTIPHFPL